MKRYTISIETFDGNHEDINSFDTFEESEWYCDNYNPGNLSDDECYIHVIDNETDESIYQVYFRPSTNDYGMTIDKEGLLFILPELIGDNDTIESLIDKVKPFIDTESDLFSNYQEVLKSCVTTLGNKGVITIDKDGINKVENYREVV